MRRIGKKEKDYVLQVLDGQFSNSHSGSMTERLEKAFAKRFNVKYAIAHINGTATLHSALQAAGVGPGDEVIVPALTMSSTSFAAMHANAIPVFADIDPETFNISPIEIRKKVTPHTKAIVPVSLYGLSPDIGPIMAIAKEHGLTVVEDDAQCFLGSYKGRVVGSIADLASFSFQSSKHMTSGEGGMVVTNDKELALRVRRFSGLGYSSLNESNPRVKREEIQHPDYDRHACLGFNYRISELCSAVALAQVERLEELVKKRVEVAALYREALKGCSWLMPQKTPQGYRHSYWTYVLKLADDTGISWHDFRRKYIESGGDGIYAAWKLTYLEPAFQNKVFYTKGCPVSCTYHKGKRQEYGLGLCPVAESIQPKLLQFKTNYLDMDVASRKAKALRKTVEYFNKRSLV